LNLCKRFRFSTIISVLVLLCMVIQYHPKKSISWFNYLRAVAKSTFLKTLRQDLREIMHAQIILIIDYSACMRSTSNLNVYEFLFSKLLNSRVGLQILTSRQSRGFGFVVDD
jgi:hypothetical protein